jgi:hypothetical protein
MVALKGDRLKTYIALFRGINVGGSNVLPMKELNSLLESLSVSGWRMIMKQVVTVMRPGNRKDRPIFMRQIIEYRQ